MDESAKNVHQVPRTETAEAAATGSVGKNGMARPATPSFLSLLAAASSFYHCFYYFLLSSLLRDGLVINVAALGLCVQVIDERIFSF